nr:ATP-binding protein [Methanobacterium formicicum]
MLNHFFLTKYIEQWGSGTNKMIEACVNEGLPEPDFNEVGDDFRVILTRSRVNEILENPDLINNRQWKAIDYLKSNDIITSIEYAELFNCSHRTARMDLKGLVDLGIFEKKGKGESNSLYSYQILPAIAGNCRQW